MIWLARHMGSGSDSVPLPVSNDRRHATTVGAVLSDKQNEATSLIVEQLVESGIKLVASLPDDWIAPLIRAVDEDERFKHVPVNREESAIGLCSGAYFGGIPSLAL